MNVITFPTRKTKDLLEKSNLAPLLIIYPSATSNKYKCLQKYNYLNIYMVTCNIHTLSPQNRLGHTHPCSVPNTQFQLMQSMS